MNEGIRTALLTPAVTGLAGFTVLWPNTTATPPQGRDWLAVHIISASNTIATLGPQGVDEATGILQIDCNTPSGQGDIQLRKTIAVVKACYKSRTRLTSGSQTVSILSVTERGGSNVNTYYRVPIEIRWKAFETP